MKTIMYSKDGRIENVITGDEFRYLTLENENQAIQDDTHYVDVNDGNKIKRKKDWKLEANVNGFTVVLSGIPAKSIVEIPDIVSQEIDKEGELIYIHLEKESTLLVSIKAPAEFKDKFEEIEVG